jgi:putative ABC transport system permease protein
MKYVHYIYANIWRKKFRCLLTIGSFGVALFLFGLLTTIYNGFYMGIDAAGADRLITRNKISLITFLPYAHKGKIEAVDGVDLVVPFVWFGGYYQDQKNFFAQFATEPEGCLDMFSEFLVAPDQQEAFFRDREGCLVGRELANRFGWKIGDRIPIQGTIFSGTWEFNIRAIYDGDKEGVDETGMYFHYKLLEERVDFVKGAVGWYSVKVTDPALAEAVCAAIDGVFENSPSETKTEPEKLFMVGFAKQMGNIKLILLVVGGVVIFTLLLVTGSTMAMAIRERTGELAILKTMGYPDGLVLVLVLLESLFYAGIGGGLGLLLSKLFTLGGDPTKGMLPSFYLSNWNLLSGVGLIAITGFLSGILPAVNAMRLEIVNALRRI